MRPPPATADTDRMLRASARPVDGSLRHEVLVDGRHVLYTDEPARVGGTDSAGSPHELLAAALAACISTTIVLAAHARGWPTDGLRVDVEYDHKATPRRFRAHVTLPHGLTDDQRERLARIGRTCPVGRALAGAAEVEETYTAAPRAA